MPVGRFFSGFRFVIDGWKLADRIPGAKKWIRIPLLIDFVLLVTGLYFGFGYIGVAVKAAILFFLDNPESFTGMVLYYPLYIIFSIGFLGFFIFTVYLIASLVASPFNAVLSEKVLSYYGQYKDEKIQLSTFIRNSFGMLLVSLKRTVLLFVVGVILLLLSFVPVVNLVTAFCAFVILAFDASDYAMETKKMKLSERLQFLKSHLPEYCGMGAFVGLTTLIPGLILLAMPYAVIGSSSLIANQEGKNVTKADSPGHPQQL